MSRLAFAFLVLAFLLVSPTARADAVMSGTKSLRPWFEITGTEEHPDYLFVVYPYIDCPREWEELEEEEPDPAHDRVTSNYQVIRKGERYELPKFCDPVLYAFEKKGVSTELQKAPDDFGFHRKKGDELVIIKEFDGLRRSEKRRFIEEDPRVRRPGFPLDFARVVSDRRPFKTTLDVLRVASVGPSGLSLEGVKVVLSGPDMQEQVLPYEGGKRPAEAGGDDIPVPQEWLDYKAELEAQRTWRKRRRYLMAGAGALVFVGAGTAVFARRRRRKETT